MTSYRPVVIIWRDITSKSGWLDQNELDEYVMDDKENICYQCGFLYEEDENQIVLLNSYFENKDVMGDATKIPKAVVIDIKYI